MLVMVHLLKHCVFPPQLRFLEVRLFFFAVMMGLMVVIYQNLQRVVDFVRDYSSLADLLLRYQIHL